MPHPRGASVMKKRFRHPGRGGMRHAFHRARPLPGELCKALSPSIQLIEVLGCDLVGACDEDRLECRVHHLPGRGPAQREVSVGGPYSHKGLLRFRTMIESR